MRCHFYYSRVVSAFGATVLLCGLLSGGALSAAPFVRGDTDLSGDLDITDGIRTLGFLFLGNPAQLDCLDAGDSDDSGELTITDGIYLFRFLFPGGPRPPAPFPECDEDPTGDALDCASFPPCAETEAPLPPEVTPPLSPTREESVRLAIQASTATTVIEVAGGRTLVRSTEGPGGVFTVDVPLVSNRINRLHVTAESAGGGRSAPATIVVIQDSTPPFLFVDEPVGGESLFEDTVTVVGRVSDLLSGFMGLDVQVANEAANVVVGIGTNGTFERAGVPLALGRNEIAVTATDAVGNSVTENVVVERIPVPTDTPRLELVSGNNQEGTVDEVLPFPVVLRVLEPGGQPRAGHEVTFHVERSNGRLGESSSAAATSTLLELAAVTDAQGVARAFWRLGTDAGCGNNRLRVTSSGAVGRVVFCASAQPGPPSQINVSSGNGQRVETSAPAPEKLRVWVSDGCNGIEGVRVTFDVISGTGFVNDRRQAIVETSRTGHASVTFRAGSEAGNQVVQADFTGNPSLPAMFTTFCVPRSADGSTMLHGVVLDNARQPIGGARLDLEFPGKAALMAVTDEDGGFAFRGILFSGPAGLGVDGTVATRLGGATIPAGTFPALHYDIVMVPGAENTLSAPVLLPALADENQRSYSTTEDTVLGVDGIAGLRMVVKAGSMRLADGSVAPDGTLMSLNQVHHDDIPMPMPDGAAPPFAWTLQPAGATFEPPIQITYPNMSSLPAAAVAYFLSFDHDTNKFEIVASGHVTDDGAEIVTDPGTGLRLAGWGCNCPPYAVAGNCKSEEDEHCGSSPGKSPDGCKHRFLRPKPDGEEGCEPYACGPSENDWLKANWEKVIPLGIVGKGILENVRVNIRLGAYPEGSSGRVANAHRHIWWQCSVTRNFGIDTAQGWAEAHERGSHPRGGCGGSNENAPCNEDHLLDTRNNQIGQMAALDPGCQDQGCDSLAFDIATGQKPKYPPALFLTCALRKKISRETPRTQNCIDAAGGGAGLIVPPCPNLAVMPAEVSLAVGDSTPLTVLLEDCSGALEDRTTAASGTIYMLWGEAAEITEDGVVTALKPGVVTLVVASPGPGDEPTAVESIPVTVFTPEDRDGDGIPDDVELSYDLDPDNFGDSFGDLDGDQLLNIEEHRLGTALDDADTDGDGRSDSDEVHSGLSDPLTVDTAGAGFQFSVAGAVVDANPDGSFTLNNVPAADEFGPGGPGTTPDFVSDDPVRVVGVAEIDGVTHYAYSPFFQFRDGETYLVDSFIVSTEPPPIPVSLRLFADPTVLAPGESVQLVAVGTRVGDGASIDLTQAASATVYRTSNPRVATVGPDGLLEARSRGRVFVTAVNQGVTAVAELLIATDTTTELTVTGVLHLPDGSPAAEAQITALLGADVTAAADGSFSLALRIPAGTIAEITMAVEVDGVRYSTTVSIAELPPGGMLDLGTVTLEPVRALDFVGRREVPLPGRPIDVALGDLDGDDILDLVSASGVEGTAHVLFGKSGGSFEPVQALLVGQFPGAVALDDLDGDSRLDLVTANAGSDNVSVVLNADDRNFRPAVDYAAGRSPSCVATGDFSGDALPDLAVTGAGETMALLVGRGAGAFEDADFVEVDFGASAVVVAQLDGAGPADVAVATGVDVLVFLATGDGGLGNGTRYQATLFPRGLVAGEVTGDGVMDLVVSDQQGGLTVLRGSGGGTFDALATQPAGSHLDSVALADFDGDGLIDIVASDVLEGTVKVLRAAGAGAFSPAVTYGVSAGPEGIEVGDLDGGGNLDVAVAARLGQSVSLLRGDGAGGFLVAAHYELGGSTSGLAIAQTDGQGGPDLIACVPDAGVVEVLSETGDGVFGASVSYAGNAPRAVVAEDFSDDGRLDLAVANFGGGDVSLFLGQENGTFVADGSFAVGTQPIALAAADLDGNARRDLISINQDNDAVVLLANLEGGFEAPVSYEIGANPRGVAIGDLDGEEELDFVVSGGRLSVFFSTGGGTFTDGMRISTIGTPAGVGIADFDGDGAADLAVALRGNDTVGVYFNVSVRLAPRRTLAERRRYEEYSLGH